MTTQPKSADPVLPPLPFSLLAFARGDKEQAVLDSTVQAYGRACYEKARADLIAELRPVVVCLETSRGLHHTFAPVGLASDTERTARRLNQQFCRLAIIPEK